MPLVDHVTLSHRCKKNSLLVQVAKYFHNKRYPLGIDHGKIRPLHDHCNNPLRNDSFQNYIYSNGIGNDNIS